MSRSDDRVDDDGNDGNDEGGTSDYEPASEPYPEPGPVAINPDGSFSATSVMYTRDVLPSPGQQELQLERSTGGAGEAATLSQSVSQSKGGLLPAAWDEDVTSRYLFLIPGVYGPSPALLSAPTVANQPQLDAGQAIKDVGKFIFCADSVRDFIAGEALDVAVPIGAGVAAATIALLLGPEAVVLTILGAPLVEMSALEAAGAVYATAYGSSTLVMKGYDLVDCVVERTSALASLAYNLSGQGLPKRPPITFPTPTPNAPYN